MTVIHGKDGKIDLNRTIPSDEKSNESKLSLAFAVGTLRKKTSKPVVRRPRSPLKIRDRDRAR